MKRHKGFTLIELLIVIAIIGILTSVILASLSKAKLRGRDTKRIADLKQLQQAVENYFENNSEYPTTSDLTSLYPTYLSGVPKDPSGSHYLYAGTLTTYCIGANLEAGIPSGASPTSSCSLVGEIGGTTYKVGSQ